MTIMCKLLRRARHDDEGVAMITVMLMGVVASLMAALVATVTIRELDDSTRATNRSIAFQTAEAGINDYTAKLAENQTYYLQQVHVGESTRKPASGANVAAGGTWISNNVTWTYPNGRDAWRALGNGYEYNLQITAPSAGSASVTIVSTGRRTGTTSGYRTVETRIRPASIADFQMISNTSISYGSAATTRGKIYAGNNSNVTHDGDAYADIYAEGSVNGSTAFHDGAKGYGSSTIRTKLPTKIDFSSFAAAPAAVKTAAQAGGLYLNASTGGWKLVFDANGTVAISKCTVNGGHLAASTPTCTAYSTPNVPSNGAIYAEQSVQVSGVVNGVVTVVSNDDVVIGGNISYAGDDVLGLIARGDMYVANYVPNNLDWRAATIAQTGVWASYTNSGDHGTMTFTGSTATYGGGSMSMFTTRNYVYDTTLQYLRPPYFPFISNAYTVDLFREIGSGAT